VLHCFIVLAGRLEGTLGAPPLSSETALHCSSFSLNLCHSLLFIELRHLLHSRLARLAPGCVNGLSKLKRWLRNNLIACIWIDVLVLALSILSWALAVLIEVIRFCHEKPTAIMSRTLLAYLRIGCFNGELLLSCLLDGIWLSVASGSTVESDLLEAFAHTLCLQLLELYPHLLILLS